MANLSYNERRRRACMMVDEIVRGASHAEAAEKHGMSRSSASMALRWHRKMGHVRDDAGMLVWTREGRAYRAWLDDAPECIA